LPRSPKKSCVPFSSPAVSFARHCLAAAVSRPRATASTLGDSGSVRSVITVTYSLCRFFRLISSIPTCLITCDGSIFRSSFNWFSTISATVSAEMPNRLATSSALLPMSIRSTYSSKR